MHRVTVVRGGVSRTADFPTEAASGVVRAAVASGLGVMCRPLTPGDIPIEGVVVMKVGDA